MSPRVRKEKIYHAMQETIKDTAWRHIAESGGPALSLRAIARELEVTAPALYRYFPDRDALVTALIVDAYNSLADAQETAVGDIPVENYAERIAALGLAYRAWAVTYPQRYQLIFGTPLPGYHAPEMVTVPVAARALQPLTRAINDAYSAGKLRTGSLSSMTPELESMLEAWRDYEGGTALEALYLTVIVWSRVHGLVMLEITEHIPPFLSDPGEIFRREIKNIILQYIGDKQ